MDIYNRLSLFYSWVCLYVIENHYNTANMKEVLRIIYTPTPQLHCTVCLSSSHHPNVHLL